MSLAECPHMSACCPHYREACDDPRAAHCHYVLNASRNAVAALGTLGVSEVKLAEIDLESTGEILEFLAASKNKQKPSD